ncbi:hypothetical protein A6A40_23910 (plasmid) [Azospirillum humicireducens]|uniref:Uncharacterized protein n=1 Tax=Azospirillum humicireducens TaxID=1226968 RepID=A0A2R4VUI2_9PROT|nr:hypothetical protein [Azospirillum humicireducens]AWB08087.1 hypothetical protein A6A40_23910 [Azospirillum humicireducens]
MTAARRCKALGKWRLTDADQWDRAYLDLVELADIRFDEIGRCKMVFGALQADLVCETDVSVISFGFEGRDEMLPSAAPAWSNWTRIVALRSKSASTTPTRSRSRLTAW